MTGKNILHTSLFGKNAHFDQYLPEEPDHLTTLIVKKIALSAKIGRGWLVRPLSLFHIEI
jgi:hypothetical protein